MKKLITALAIAMSGIGSLVASTPGLAQTPDPKMEWAVKVVALQQGPELDRLVEQLANNTTGELLQNWRPKLLASVPKARQAQVTEELNTELKKYFDKNTADFKKVLQDLPVELEDKFIFKHPRSGLFNIDQTLTFTREHYLHHERQLNALL